MKPDDIDRILAQAADRAFPPDAGRSRTCARSSHWLLGGPLRLPSWLYSPPLPRQAEQRWGCMEFASSLRNRRR